MSSCTFHDADPSLLDRRLFDIVEQSYSRRQKAVVFVQSEERAAALDRLLWVLRQDSFIPHRIFARGEQDSDVPVAIVTNELDPIGASVLVADGHCSLEYASRFEVIHEFVNRSSPRMHEACRERFRAYRARGIPVEHAKSQA